MRLFFQRYLSTTRGKLLIKYVDEYGSAYKESGSLREKPTSVKLGWVKSLLMVLPFLYLGSVISREGALYMEEHDIFVPADED